MDAVGSLQRERPFPLRETSFSFKGNFGFLEEKRAFPLLKSSGYFSIKDVYMYTKHGKRVLYGWWMKLHAKWINVMADSGCIVYICNKIGK